MIKINLEPIPYYINSILIPLNLYLFQNNKKDAGHRDRRLFVVIFPGHQPLGPASVMFLGMFGYLDEKLSANIFASFFADSS